MLHGVSAGRTSTRADGGQLGASRHVRVCAAASGLNKMRQQRTCKHDWANAATSRAWLWHSSWSSSLTEGGRNRNTDSSVRDVCSAAALAISGNAGSTLQ